MKTSYIIIILGIIISGSVIFALTFEYSFDKEYYNIEIHGMKDFYYVGDEYSFYYTLSGRGNTCGSWLVSYPDKNGVIQHNGAVVDCTSDDNRNLSYDSRNDGRNFTSLVPEIAGTYNVTVSLENGASIVYVFTVLPKTDVQVDSQTSKESDETNSAIQHVDENRYVNQALGFTIEKPDENWYFITSNQKIREKYNQPDILGGVLVVKSSTHETLGVQVRNIVDKYDNDLEKRINRIIESNPTNSNLQMENIQTDYSADGDYAYFTYDNIRGAHITHHLKIFKLANDKIYEIGASYYSTAPPSENVEKDINCIAKSFETISEQTLEFTSRC
ncbi:MAG: hypothetical protein KGZ34_02760 [Nitrosarchaeum sp.]|nr:hypothetical protein [Nitrosarchaeum sp.]